MTERYLLDTNILSDAQKPRPDPALARWMEQRQDHQLFVSTIVLGEIWQGILLAPDGRRKRALGQWFEGDHGPRRLFAGRILPLDEAAAICWAAFTAACRRGGQPRPAVDLQIAAVAKVNGCVLVTRNIRDFTPLAGEVEIVDPTVG